ncbi:hypothetical protein [Kocuria aegyptia]
MNTHQDDIQHTVELVHRTRVGVPSARRATGGQAAPGRPTAVGR